MLAIADLATALAVAGSLALFPGGTLVDALWAGLFAPVWIVAAKLSGLYDRDQRSLRHLTVDELPAIFVWTLAATTATMVFLSFTPAEAPGIPVALRSWVLAVAFAVFFRGLSRWLWRRIVPRERTLIVGAGPLADGTRRKLELFPDIHVDIVDQVEELDPHAMPDVDRIIVASQAIDEDLLADLLELCRDARIKLSVVPPARGMFGTAVRLNRVADLSVVEYTTWDVSRSTLFLKRVLDLVLGSIALVALPAGLRPRRGRDSPREPRSRALFAASRGHGREAVQDAEVPDDGRGRGGAPPAARAVRQPA